MAFGEFDENASGVVLDFLGDVPGKIRDIETALAAGDLKQAWGAAHSLNGAAKSIGAARLGQLAGDIQDVLDEDDAETAAVILELLEPTYLELDTALSPLRLTD
jgi:HPt (histidine-containing phosphotransfer) domain-containing protein